jgi:heme oxygenase
MNIRVDADGRAKRLKAATNETHERLDKRIMAAEPFVSRERYCRFVEVQCAFHRDIHALYENQALAALLPDLAQRRRLGLIEHDLADLGLAAPPSSGPPPFASRSDVPAALGWLYVAEGSNLGAAFLLKEAAKLGLSETFGARHLAGHPAGRGLHWRNFTAALDAVKLSLDEEARAVGAAKAAFARVQGLVEERLPLDGVTESREAQAFKDEASA